MYSGSKRISYCITYIYNILISIHFYKIYFSLLLMYIVSGNYNQTLTLFCFVIKMITDADARAFFGICACLALISILSSIMVLISWLMNRNSCIKNTKTLLLDYIGLIAICDILMNSKNVFYCFIAAIGLDTIEYLSDNLCVFLGFLNQLFDVLVLNSSFGLAIFLLYPLIFNKSPVQISNNKTCNINNYFIIMFISLLLSVPLLFLNVFGKTSPGTITTGYNDFAHFQCWIKPGNDIYYLFEYIPATTYVIISIFTIIFIFCYMLRYVSSKSIPLRWEIKQCFIYLLLFVFAWIFNCINRICYYNKSSTPFIIICIGWISMCFRGIANSIVWYCFTFKKSKKMNNNLKEQITLQTSPNSNIKSTNAKHKKNTNNAEPIISYSFKSATI